jgi:uncharacterized protein YuzB (UPF0349 family)
MVEGDDDYVILCSFCGVRAAVQVSKDSEGNVVSSACEGCGKVEAEKRAALVNGQVIEGEHGRYTFYKGYWDRKL